MKTTRRDLMELTARAIAIPGCQLFFQQWLQAAAQQHTHGSQAPPESDFFKSYQPKFFDAKNFEALETFTEILIPTDDTPGAREAHCASFIDFVLSQSSEFAPETQEQWRNAMAELEKRGFHAANTQKKAAIVKEISQQERDRTAKDAALAAYRLIKRETVFAFYTSREGMIGALDYRGNSFNVTFPACTHPEHHVV
jgi:hypothetical protein